MAKDLKYKILYVEDEYITRQEIATYLSDKYKNLILAKDGKEGFELFKLEKPDLVITDLKMPNMDGISMVKKIREINKEVPIIVTSAYGEEFIKFSEYGIFRFVSKPISKFSLLLAVEDALKNNKKRK